MGRKGKSRDSDDSKLREDTAETARRSLQEAIGERPKTKPPADRSDDEKDPEAVERGRKGGKKGGKARAESLTPERRAEIARKASDSRWEDQRSES